MVHAIHAGKTAALIRAAVQAGAIMAGASEAQVTQLDGYALRVGLAFQIIDDVLDVVETSSELGKTPGKDAQRRSHLPHALGRGRITPQGTSVGG